MQKNEQTDDFVKVAVVVLTYNNKDLLEKFLPPIVNTDYDQFQVYVVDNASSDGTSEWLEENFPTVKIVRVDINKGFTNGYVQGLKQINSEYYVLVSSDIEVTDNWLRPVIELMDSDKQIGAAQPKIRYYRDREYFEYAGAAGGFIDKYGYPFCRGRIFFTLEKDLGQYDENMEVFWATGGCFFVRAEVYDKLGGLDNTFFAHMEEIDLCWRMKNAGHKVYACSESTVFHVGGAVITYGSPAKAYRNFRNGLIMIFKNLPMSQLIWKLPFRLILDGVAAIRALLKGNFGEFGAIFRAHMGFYYKLPLWIKKRKQAQKFRSKKPNLHGIYPKSIVYNYFIKQKKKFSDLKW